MCTHKTQRQDCTALRTCLYCTFIFAKSENMFVSPCFFSFLPLYWTVSTSACWINTEGTNTHGDSDLPAICMKTWVSIAMLNRLQSVSYPTAAWTPTITSFLPFTATNFLGCQLVKHVEADLVLFLLKKDYKTIWRGWGGGGGYGNIHTQHCNATSQPIQGETSWLRRISPAADCLAGFGLVTCYKPQMVAWKIKSVIQSWIIIFYLLIWLSLLNGRQLC